MKVHTKMIRPSDFEISTILNLLASKNEENTKSIDTLNPSQSTFRTCLQYAALNRLLIGLFTAGGEIQGYIVGHSPSILMQQETVLRLLGIEEIPKPAVSSLRKCYELLLQEKYSERILIVQSFVRKSEDQYNYLSTLLNQIFLVAKYDGFKQVAYDVANNEALSTFLKNLGFSHIPHISKEKNKKLMVYSL